MEMAKICPLCNEPIWPGPNELFLDPKIGYTHEVCPKDSMLMKPKNSAAPPSSESTTPEDGGKVRCDDEGKG